MSSIASLPADVSSAAPSSSSSTPTSSTTLESSTSISSTSSTVSSTTAVSSTTSQSSSASSSAPSSSSTTSVLTTLSETSTSVFASTSLTTSNGQVITAVVTVTTKINPGTIITNSAVSSQNQSSGGGTNVGAIVGGVVGGIAGLSVILALVFFLLRRSRSKDEFDGNFDPDYVSSGARLGGNSGGGGTLPRMNIDEDDGMGGRLESGVVGGGIISPYSYTPSGHTNMSQVQPSNYSGASSAAPLVGGAAAGAVGAAALRNRHSQSQQSHSNYGSGAGGSYYPGSVSHEGSAGTATSPSAWSTNSAPYPASVNPYAPSLSTPVELTGASSEHSSSGAGPYGGMASVSSGAYRPRSAKEIEAMGGQMGGQPHVMNPDEGGAGPSSAYPPGAGPPMQHRGYNEQSRLAYLQNGPGHAPMPAHMQHEYSHPADGGMPDALRPGGSPGVIVHQDAGRVPVRKGERTQEEDEQQPREIPPTYDSLVNREE